MLILMCGLPFSGKSTLARAIVGRTGAEYVSLDEINRERGLGFGEDGIAVEEWERSHAVALGRIRDRLPEVDVVLDDTCCYRWIRDRYRARATSLGAETRVVYLDIPAGTIIERMESNRETGVRRGIRREIFDEVSGGFEVPDDEETVIAFDGSVSIETWVEQNFRSRTQG